MQIDFVPLFSGSSGNAIYIRAADTRILVDAGVSASRVANELEKIGVEAGMLDAIVITHEHSDHVSGVGVLSRRHMVPLYATEGTWSAMNGKLGKLLGANRRVVEPGRDFYVGDMAITPFSIPHDASQPVGYTVSVRGVKFAVATDIGHMTGDIINCLDGSHAIVLESNHDVEMLKAGRYPYELKRRILGHKGHLSNDAAAQAAVELAARGVRHIILGHLSAENNHPSLAIQTVKAAVENAGLAGNTAIDIAGRDGISAVYHFEV
ncbi:MAG: MBL fold metallo-hydrolase [Clostridia bacterium]|nr:MBL fold metallo-hydrolase [Clostridia bacterium]